MSCALIAGYAIECRDSVGGVEAVYIIENSALYDASGVSRVTSASGTVTALTKNRSNTINHSLDFSSTIDPSTISKPNVQPFIKCQVICIKYLPLHKHQIHMLILEYL